MSILLVGAPYRAALEQRGCAVIAVPDGRAALHHLSSESAVPTLVVADAKLADMSGNELAAIMGAMSRLANVPIVLLGERTVPGSTKVSFEPKPAGPVEIDRLLDQLLERVRAALTSPPPDPVSCASCGAKTPRTPGPGHTFCHACGEPISGA